MRRPPHLPGRPVAPAFRPAEVAFVQSSRQAEYFFHGVRGAEPQDRLIFEHDPHAVIERHVAGHRREDNTVYIYIRASIAICRSSADKGNRRDFSR